MREDLRACAEQLEQVRKRLTEVRHTSGNCPFCWATPHSETCVLVPIMHGITHALARPAVIAALAGEALPTAESERAALVAEVGECCKGPDPFCAGGCLVERAIRKRAALRPAARGDAEAGERALLLAVARAAQRYAVAHANMDVVLDADPLKAGEQMGDYIAEFHASRDTLFGELAALQAVRPAALTPPAVTDAVAGSCVDGFLDGQATAYCEQVRAGSRPAGVINCPVEHADRLRDLVLRDGCLAKVTRDADRALVWIYRYEFLTDIIDRIERLAEGADPFSIWASGKLFGYSDHDIAQYVAAALTPPAPASGEDSR